MVHGGFPLHINPTSRLNETVVTREMEQKGVCNYNVHLEKTATHLELQNGHLEELKILAYVSLAVVFLIVVFFVVKKTVKSIKAKERRRVMKTVNKANKDSETVSLSAI